MYPSGTCLNKKEAGQSHCSGVWDCLDVPKTSISICRAKSLSHHHNPLAFPFAALALPISPSSYVGSSAMDKHWNRLENQSRSPAQSKHAQSITLFFFSPWSPLFGDVLLHQIHTNCTASTRQHCHRLVLPPQCGRQEPPALLVVSCSSYIS